MAKCLSAIHMATAFCKFQNYPPDDLWMVCVIVMRSANMIPDGELHEKNVLHDSLNAADTNSLDFPSCCNRAMMEILMLKINIRKFSKLSVKL